MISVQSKDCIDLGLSRGNLAIGHRFPQIAGFGTNAYPNRCASNQLEGEFDQEDDWFGNMHWSSTTVSRRGETFGLAKGSIYPLALTARLSVQFLQKNLTVDLQIRAIIFQIVIPCRIVPEPNKNFTYPVNQ